MRNILMILTLVMSMSGCMTDNGVDGILTEVESCMDTAPDSALRLLESIDRDGVGDGAVGARYALLYSQALDKNYVDVRDDSLITIAVRYYQAWGDKRHTMLSCYYRARILYNSADYTHAIYSILESEQLARQLNDTYYQARTNEVLADIYASTYNLPQEIKYRSIASSLYKNIGYKDNYLYSMVALSRAYANNDSYDKALNLLDSLNTDIRDTRDSVLIASLIKSYILVYLYRGDDRLGDYDRAKLEYDELQKYHEYYKYNNYDYSNLANIYIEKGYLDSAQYTINRAMDNRVDMYNDVSVKHSQYLLAKNNGDFVIALRLHEELFEKTDSFVRTILEQTAATAHKDFYKRESDMALLKAQNLKIYLIFCGIIAVIVLVSLYVIYREKLKRKNMEIDNIMNEIQTRRQNIELLSSEIDNQKMQSAQLSRLVKELFSDKFTTINQLCDEYFEKKDSDKIKYTIYSKVKSEILKLSNPDEIKKLEKAVNDCKDNIALKLRSQFPDMKEADLTFLILVFSGLSQRAICLIMDIKLGNYYNKRQRLRCKIIESTAKDKYIFLQNISK
ncbi:MAG: hypothetical protein NC117_09060 [Pseudoflavonifractor sp.]|nr:hypothetical protein [Pseudoflavonifractor sp.]